MLCFHGMAFKKDLGMNYLALDVGFIYQSVLFEGFRFIAFLGILQRFFEDPKENYAKLVTVVVLNIFFQIYSQTDLCFCITDVLQKKTGFNEKGALPRMAFSIFLGVIQSMSPSGSSAIQELVGNSKELENTTRRYYAFVWAMTFHMPTTFSAYIFLNKMYGLKGSLYYESLAERWGYVLAIYLIQEIVGEILCIIMDVVLSKTWIGYNGRYSFPKIMLEHCTKEGIYVTAVLEIFGVGMISFMLIIFK